MYEIYCKLRDAKGVKDADVVKATGITKSTFSEWKNGRSIPKLEKLTKIANYLGVTIDDLLGIEKKMVSKNDPIYDLLNVDPSLIILVKDLLAKGYCAEDLKLAVNLLDLARGTK